MSRTLPRYSIEPIRSLSKDIVSMTRGRNKYLFANAAAKRKAKKAQPATKEYVKKAVARLGERKHSYTINSVLQPVYTTSTTYPVYDLAEGVAENNRVGNQIKPTSMQLRFTMYRGNADSVCRLIVFRWKERDSSVTLASILEQGSVGTASYVNAPLILETGNRNRFDILHDKCYVLDDGKQNTVNRVINIKMSKKIGYISGSASQERMNEIYYVFISDVVLASAPSVYVQALGYFRDL